MTEKETYGGKISRGTTFGYKKPASDAPAGAKPMDEKSFFDQDQGSMRRLLIASLILFSSFSMARHPKPRANRHPAGANEGGTLRKILELEDQRAWNNPTLIALVTSPSPQISRAAMLALGRIGDTNGAAKIGEVLNKKNPALAKVAAFSLGLIGGDFALKSLSQQLAWRPEPDVIAQILVSIGRLGDKDQMKLLTRVIDSYISTPSVGPAKSSKEENPREDPLLEGACQGLGIMWSAPNHDYPVTDETFKKMVQVAQAETSAALYCAFALGKYRGNLGVISGKDWAKVIQQTRLVFARAYLLRAIGKLKQDSVAQVLVREMTTSPHTGIRIEAAKALSSQDYSPAVAAGLPKGLEGNQNNLIAATLDTIGSFGLTGAGLSPAVEKIYRASGSLWIRSLALRTLAKINPNEARPLVTQNLKQSNPLLLSAAAGSLVLMGESKDLEQAALFVNHPDVRVSEEIIDLLGTLSEDRIPDTVRSALRRSIERADAGVTSLVAQLVEKFRWKDFAQPLATVYPLFNRRDQIEAKVAILEALRSIGDHAVLPVVQSALDDPDRLVVVAAAEASKAITDQDVSNRIPQNSKPGPPLPPASEISESLRTRVKIKTTRGEFTIRLSSEAPLAATNFVRLIKKKVPKWVGYEGLQFHRVVPNFVVQGGDPRNDGFGGPGYLVRDEVSMLRHSRGTVGLATAGKDTGGCQFFVNLAPNPHLDGRYTVFGEVEKDGLSVVDRLEVGDSILSVKTE